MPEFASIHVTGSSWHDLCDQVLAKTGEASDARLAFIYLADDLAAEADRNRAYRSRVAEALKSNAVAVQDLDDADARLAALETSLDKTLSAVKGVMSPDAPLIVELETTLREISDMARSFRLLADYLQRHPEALIQGKGEFGGK